ncbi:MAG: HAD hydrolase-like protein [Collinsella sp.]
MARLSRRNRQNAPRHELEFALGIPGKNALEKLGIYSQATLDRWCEVAASFKSTISVFPGLHEVIATLSDNGCKLGIVSSRARNEYAEEIAPLSFDKYFEHIILVEDTTEHKPAPAPMLEYLRRTGANLATSSTLATPSTTNNAQLRGVSLPERMGITPRYPTPPTTSNPQRPANLTTK